MNNSYYFSVLFLIPLLISTSLGKQAMQKSFSKVNSHNSIMISKTITLKVLLVEFKDVKHRNLNYPANLNLPAYTYDDFYNMLFSENKYVSPGMYSPDGKEVFGILRDYYRIMSNNNLNVTGYILNRDSNNDNIPDWIKLDSNKSYYDNDRGKEFRTESKFKAIEAKLDTTKNDETFLVIIYAGHTYRSKANTLNPEAFILDHEYIMGERFACGAPYREERDDPSKNPVSHFAHIGIHVHEFCHLLGCMDMVGEISNYNWCLMSAGNYNGPNREGACPAPINPYLRWMFRWIPFYTFNGSITTNLKYNLQKPEVYILHNKCYPYNFFLVEYRKFDSQMKLGNYTIKDYNSFNKCGDLKNGLFIWRKLIGNEVKLLYSSATDCSEGDEQIFPGREDVRVISPWSDNRECNYSNYWIPNTKSSDNCGVEIKEINNDSCIVDLYENYPQYASPSKPRNLNVKLDSLVKIVWEENTEPDLEYYKIYKKSNNLKFELYDSTKYPSFVDYEEKLSLTIDSNNYVLYKITSVDSENKESTFSKEIKIAVENKFDTNVDLN